ncbi:MAG: hypothetical protein ABL897_03170 [Hyphomicrobium sp.]
MIKALLSSFIISGLALTLASAAEAGGKHRQYRDGPQVKGYSERRGGYSYSYADSVNTYGNSRTKYGGASVYRDPNLDRQTEAGPFDHGFFFDSSMGSHGGDSPYMN